MFKYLIGLVLIASCLGCSTNRVKRTAAKRQKVFYNKVEADKQLRPYVRLLGSYAAQLQVNVEFEGLKLYIFKTNHPNFKGIMGYCEEVDGYPVVNINWAYWKNSTDLERELLMFHELGHCVLKVPHHAGQMPDGTPTSIMHPNKTNANAYSKYYNQYVIQLFQMYIQVHGPSVLMEDQHEEHYKKAI